jgi:Uma2 family endonuclease
MRAALTGHVGPWTIEDVEALPDPADHARYELLTPGVLTVSPAPGTAHQRASRALANLLEAAAADAAADVDVLEAVNVEIPGGRLAVPDVVVVRGAVADRNPTRYPPGSVLLAVEIVSPSTQPQDRLIKPQLYADAGIPLYWRLELDEGPLLVVSELRTARHVPVHTLPAGTRATLRRPFPLTLDPADLPRRARPGGPAD